MSILTMSPDMNNLLYRSIGKPPIAHEERIIYFRALLTKIAINNIDEFSHYFNKKDDLIALVEWTARKEKGEPFTDNEMFGLDILNSCQIKSFGIATFKSIALDRFDKEQFMMDLGLPADYTPVIDNDDEY